MNCILSQRVRSVRECESDNANALDFTHIAFGKSGRNHWGNKNSQSLKDCICKSKSAS